MRTWLFVPGHDARKVQKALQSTADAVIIDWEDAVPFERKAEARAVTKSVLGQVAARMRCVVRVNGTHDPHFDHDVAALSELPIQAVMLPKVADPAQVINLARDVTQPIIPLIESALGIERAFVIAQADEQVERLAFGALDFVADLGATWSLGNAAIGYARARIAIADCAAGLAGAIDSVYPQLGDDDGLRQDALAARALGFVGKTLIHPTQIAIAREVFGPTPDERARAAAIMAAFREGSARGEAAIRMGNVFIDPPVVHWAEQVLAMSEADTTDA